VESRGTGDTHLGWLLQEGVHQIIHKFVGIIYPVGELTNDPNHGSLGLGFIEEVQVFAKRGDNPFVLAWVSTENVLGDNDDLLNHIRDFRLDELQE